jgi:FkbM family methyltransferase
MSRIRLVEIAGRNVFLRENTPDFRVARSNFSGEFSKSIRFADPLKYNFIIDAGGYIGTAAIIFAEAFPRAKVLTIEPSLENYRVLLRNVRSYHNIVPINRALASKSGILELFNRQTGNWGFTIVKAPADCLKPEFIHKVAVVTIAELLEEYESCGVDILKLDIEGAEYDLLRSPNWLPLVRVLMVELHDKILPGCKEAFLAATAGRRNIPTRSEKKLSLLVNGLV